MKANTKKYVIIGLAAVGIALICLSLILTFIAASGKNIIGGVGLPTFTFVFFRENGGLCSIMALLGVLSLIASLIIGIRKKK